MLLEEVTASRSASVKSPRTTAKPPTEMQGPQYFAVDNAHSSATHISESNENKTQKYSDFIKKAMDAVDAQKLAICLPYIKQNHFSRDVATESGLVRTTTQVLNHARLPEDVKVLCRHLLETWVEDRCREDDEDDLQGH